MNGASPTAGNTVYSRLASRGAELSTDKMAARSALFTLRDHNIFRTFKEGFQENAAKTQNLMDCRDDILYLWHASESCLLTLNIKTLEMDPDVNYQRLVGTESTNFVVTTVLVNPISTWVVVSGPHEATAMRLPRRSGPKGLFQGGRDTVICKSKILDERIYMSDCEIYRVRWHPNSETDSHLLILSSDNTVRLYDLDSEDQPLKHVWQIGRKEGRLPLLTALGDTAVDIFTCYPNQGIILTGNGNVHLMDIDVKSVRKSIKGPLAMYPPADDNYGLESCSILKLGDNLICIATCVGTIYHCVIIPDEQVHEPNTNYGGYRRYDNRYDSEKKIKMQLENQINSLYVVEAIELDLGLNVSDDDTSYTCPIYLVPDEGVKNRYFCYHETGLHIVTVPLVNQMENYYNIDNMDARKNLPTFNAPSVVEYAICTKTSKINIVNPSLGICLTYSTHAVIQLLSDFRIVVKLLDVDELGNMLFSDNNDAVRVDSTNRSSLNTSLSEMQKVPFNEQVQHILKHGISQPILKIARTAEPSAQECFELLSHATHIFREDYFTKIERARKEIEKRVKTLNLLKKLQLQELEEWEISKKLIISESGELNKKCEIAKNNQKLLNKRCENVRRGMSEKHSSISNAELNMTEEIKNHTQKVPKFQSEIKKIKQKQIVQKIKMQNWDEKKQEEVFLGKHLTEIIKNTLTQQTKHIQELKQKILMMKETVKQNLLRTIDNKLNKNHYAPPVFNIPQRMPLMQRYNLKMRRSNMDPDYDPRMSFNMQSRPSNQSELNEPSHSRQEYNENYSRNVDNIRRPRSIHRNASMHNTVSYLPSRRITQIDASGAATLDSEGESFIDGYNAENTQQNVMQQFITQIEQNDGLMEDNPNAEAMRIEALRDIPQSLTVKRNIKKRLSASVSRKSKHRPIGFFKRTKYRLSFWWKRIKQNIKNALFWVEFGYNAIKSVEGHFGSGVATYFRFLRWLFIMNLSISIIVISFIAIPQMLFTEHNDTFESESFSFWDIFTGHGSFANSTLYYGYYSNETMSIIDGHYFNIPYSYFFTMLASYIAMFVIISISMARSYRENFIKTKSGLKNIYANKILCSWDFSIATEEAAALKSKSFYNNIRELLSEGYTTQEESDMSQKCYSICIKIFINLFVLLLLCLTGFIMWTLMDDNLDLIPDIVNPVKWSTNRSILMAFIITTIMFTFPIIFSWIVRFEKYKNPRTVLYITLARTFVLEAVIVSILGAFWLKSNNYCWETSLGQEIYRLIIFDFLFSLIGLPLFEYLRCLICKHLWEGIGMPEFDIARNTLGLIYNQTLLWLGLFYSPMIIIVVTLKMGLQFYIRQYTILKNCQPSSRSWRAAQTQTLFLFLIFVSLLCILLTFGYTFVSVLIGRCGPFKDEEYIYIFFIRGILNIRQDNTFFSIIMYFTKPGVVAFILIAMSVGVYYLHAKGVANKMMVSQLRDILVSQAKDKEFLLNAISNVSNGRWMYSNKSKTLIDATEPKARTSNLKNERKPSNSNYQFSPNRNMY